MLLKTKPPKCQTRLPEERGKLGTMITENIQKEILSWPGVSSNPYHLGGVEFRVNKRDMGHIHGEKLVDLPFPAEIRKDLDSFEKSITSYYLPRIYVGKLFYPQ